MVCWELTEFTVDTYTIGSDTFTMDFTLTIDLLQFNSAHGKCKILVKEVVMPKIIKDSERWN